MMVLAPFSLFPQSADEMDRQAQEYFDNKDFSKAVVIWLNILDIEPGNAEIQKKVEMLYELKQKKDIELERSKMDYKKAKMELYKNKDEKISDDDAEANLERAREMANNAFDEFKTAYRIDPNDAEMQLVREEMERLEKYLQSEEQKLSRSKKDRERARGLAILARKAMDESRYKDALDRWDEILTFMPDNIDAIEGKRQATLAIENIMRFESIKKFLQSGVENYNKEDYKVARQDFMNVLQLDPENNTARDYIERIDDRLTEKRKYEQREKQADLFYVSGLKNLKENKFDEAEDDFNNILSLYDNKNYKDTKERLASISGLRKDYDRRQAEARNRDFTDQLQNGMIALSEGRYQEAISFFEKALKLDPGNKEIPLYLQRAKDAQKLIDEEVVDENSPYYDVVNPLIVSGKKLYDSGKYDESRKRWIQILELFPSNLIANEYDMKCRIKLNPETRDSIVSKFISDAEAYMKIRDYRNAYRKYALVKSIFPEYPQIDTLISRTQKSQTFGGGSTLTAAESAETDRRYKLGMSYYQMGGEENVKKALVELRWVVQKDPGNIKAIIAVNKIEAQFRGGTALAGTGGRKLTPEQEAQVRKYYNNGINYYQNNEYNKAISEWRKVLIIDPRNEKARSNIIKTTELLGRGR
ncbi:MAG TPA: tetratricopeptide repeat protein [Spirochaetota bacterium]|nr:tetratricopeptide repeat protein [Spirochaetota bacterium]